MPKTASGRPVVVTSIPVTGEPLGETVTPDGKYLLAADGNGAVVISVARAESGAAGAVLGTLAAPGGSGLGQGALSGSAIEVATSRNGRYAFVTLEYDQRAAVFNLAAASSREGAVPAQHPVGIRASPARSGPTLSPPSRGGQTRTPPARSAPPRPGRRAARHGRRSSRSRASRTGSSVRAAPAGAVFRWAPSTAHAGILRDQAPPPLDCRAGVDAVVVSTENELT